MLGLLKKEEKEELEEIRRMPNPDFFTFARCVPYFPEYKSQFFEIFDMLLIIADARKGGRYRRFHSRANPRVTRPAV